MKLPTVGIRPEILHSWLQVSGCTRSELAARLQVTRGRVSQLFLTDTKPSAHLIAKLLAVTGLPFERLFCIVTTLPEQNGAAAAPRRNGKSRAVRVDGAPHASPKTEPTPA
jgi:transcriptional regulator with XRE-family HTH domain